MPTSFFKLSGGFSHEISLKNPSPLMGEGKGGGEIMRNYLEKTIGDLLREKGWTLSIAESCTGGLICDRITNVPGSSDYFEGGMVTYSNESKAKHLGIPLDYIKKYGAVSPQVARRMAQGVRKVFNTTIGLSTTGVAGPTGGTKRAPIGRVFIGVAKGKITWVKKLDLRRSRREIKKKATEKALQFFYGKIVHGGRLRKQATSKK
jgi:nicotinamide-nucleotide amidase